MLASAVLITKEKSYPQEILDLLPKFDEVLIKTECPSILARYELAQKAKNNIIYVQDDDCITDVEALRSMFNGRLTVAVKEHHQNFYAGSGVTLVGFGAFFTKDMINFDPYLDRYGVSPLFLSQADRVFTYLNQPFNQVPVETRNLPTATDNTRMSNQEDHYDNLGLILKQLHNLHL